MLQSPEAQLKEMSAFALGRLAQVIMNIVIFFRGNYKFGPCVMLLCNTNVHPKYHDNQLNNVQQSDHYNREGSYFSIYGIMNIKGDIEKSSIWL